MDTNVLVSGLLSPFNPPGLIIGALASGAHQVCYDVRILAEYRDVLARPRFGFRPTSVEALLTQLIAHGVRTAATPLPATLPHVDDQPFLEVALAAGAECLITGNQRHFPADQCAGVDVVTPRQFLGIVAE